MAMGTLGLCFALLGMAFAAPHVTPAQAATHERCKAYAAAEASFSGSSLGGSYFLYVLVHARVAELSVHTHS